MCIQEIELKEEKVTSKTSKHTAEKITAGTSSIWQRIIGHQRTLNLGLMWQ